MNYSFKKYQPTNLRLWHWLNFIVICGSIGTALLRKTWLNSKANAEIISTKAAELGISMDLTQARKVAIAIRTPMWDWHVICGFILGFLLLFRVYVYFKNRNLPKESVNFKAKSKLHKNLVHCSYYLFYSITFYMVSSGLLLNFEEELHLPEALAGPLGEIHELMLWFFMFFVVAHIVGLVVSELRGDKGLISDMINGGDKTSSNKK